MTVELAPPPAHLWLPLLQRLTDVAPGWLVWKNADAGLAGRGDIDSVAPRAQWNAIQREFRDWAQASKLGPVIVCRHIPKMLDLVALGDESETFMELDLNCGKVFRGSVLFRPEQLLALSAVDPRGFRRLRPGAEGLLLLVFNGMGRGGRMRPSELRRRRIPELLREDRPGVVSAARLFGPASRAVLRAAEEVLEDRWDQRALLEVEAWSLARAIIEPDAALGRAWFRLVTKRRCPVLRAVFGGRRITADRDAWLASVARTHRVYALGTGH